MAVTVAGVEATIRDTAGVVAGPGCAQADAATLVCRTGIEGLDPYLDLRLGDRDDRASVAGGGSTGLIGGPGDDVLNARGQSGTSFVGGPGRDRMTGGPSVDIFLEGKASNGSDTMRGGGGGRDSVYYGDRKRAVRVTFDRKRDDGQAAERDLVGREVERAEGGAGPDHLRGTPAHNRLTGGKGSDVLIGAGGEDRLVGGEISFEVFGRSRHHDRLLGGPGDDRLEGAAGASVLDGGSGHDTLLGNGRLVARDGDTDLVWCAAIRRDLALLDAYDHVAGLNGRRCARIRRRGPAAAVPLARDLWDPTPIADSDGRIDIHVGCPQDGPRRCSGTVRAFLAGAVLGVTQFEGEAGGGDMFFFHVPPERRAILPRDRPLPLKITVISDDRGGIRRVRSERYSALLGVCLVCRID